MKKLIQRIIDSIDFWWEPNNYGGKSADVQVITIIILALILIIGWARYVTA